MGSIVFQYNIGECIIAFQLNPFLVISHSYTFYNDE